MATALNEIVDRLTTGAPLLDEDVPVLLATSDLVRLGVLAEEACRRRHGAHVTFVKVRHVEPGVEVPHEEDEAVGEVRLSGAVTLEQALGAARGARARWPSAVISGFDLADVQGWSPSLPQALEALAAAGLDLVAEATIDRMSDDASGALALAAAAGVPVMRLTIDSYAAREPADLAKQARDLAAAVTSIKAFAPLPKRESSREPGTGYDDVKLVAVARLVASTVDSIQVSWRQHGPKLAQVALLFGANDLDDVSPGDAAPMGPRRSEMEELRRNIRAASRVPAERNGRFEVIA